jgi:hypothetical protein
MDFWLNVFNIDKSMFFNHSLLNVIINVASQKINNIFIENNIQGGIEMHHNM